MTIIRKIAQQIRHLPTLEHAEGLWSALRGPYHWLLNAGGNGVNILVGGIANVRIPPEYTGSPWETFEPETVVAFLTWIREHSGGMVLDLGCSLGIYSAIALFGDPHTVVVAFDSDLASLRATQRLTQYAKGDRLQLVYGLLADQGTDGSSLSDATSATALELADASRTGDVGTTRYVCLTDEQTESIPRRRLDDLFAEGFGGRPCLIKCDVEGAEQLVLSGGEQILRQFSPDLLLSVHPSALPSYCHSTYSVRSYLTGLGYAIRCLAIDHEEHWWCQCKN